MTTTTTETTMNTATQTESATPSDPEAERLERIHISGKAALVTQVIETLKSGSKERIVTDVFPCAPDERNVNVRVDDKQAVELCERLGVECKIMSRLDRRSHVVFLFTIKAAATELLKAIDAYNADRTPERMQLVLDLHRVLKNLEEIA